MSKEADATDKIAEIEKLCRRCNNPGVILEAHSLASKVIAIIDRDADEMSRRRIARPNDGAMKQVESLEGQRELFA